MGIVRTGESGWEKEEARWNTPKGRPVLDRNGEQVYNSDGTPMMGMGANGFERFPAMLYKAQKKSNGKVVVIDGEPDLNHFSGLTASDDYSRALFAVTAFNKQNQRIVQNKDEEKRAHDEGWRDTPQEALSFYERLEEEIGRAAAETNFAVQAMSAKAREEHRAATDATHEHVTDVIPPKRKRGRPAKVSHA